MTVSHILLVSCLTWINLVQAGDTGYGSGAPRGHTQLSLEYKIQAILSKYKLPSGSIMVRKGFESYTHNTGIANHNTRKKIDDKTLFLIASNTKHYTATAIMRLVDLGKIKLTDKVTKYFPEFNDSDWVKNGKAATIHDLLRHTSGVVDYNDHEPVKSRFRKKKITMKHVLEALKGKSLKFKPDSKFEYSNSGYVLLGEIVRRASGKSFSKFMQKEFFDKHGLKNTFVGRPNGKKGQIAESYDTFPGETPKRISQNTRFRHDGETFTDGNIYATGQDVAKWTNLVASGKILSPDSTKKMFTPGRKDYGYGMGIGKSSSGKTIYAHNGEWIGYTSVVNHLPAKDATIVWLRNDHLTGKLEKKVMDEIIKSL